MNEITNDYRAGITDPARIVGKVERKPGHARKKIQE